MNRRELTRLLRAHGIRPQRRRSQNFLVNPSLAETIAEQARDPGGMPIVEIGPGLGALTSVLAEFEQPLLAVDLDYKLVPILKERLAGHAHVRVECADVLDIDLRQALARLDVDAAVAPGAGPAGQCIVIGNLPYALTTLILEWLIGQRGVVSRAVLTMQAEVAQRLKAQPGAKAYGSLSCFVQYHFAPTVVCSLPASAFHPAPDVASTCLRFDPLSEPPVWVSDEELLFRVIRAAFGQRRKTLLNSLSAGLDLDRDRLLDVFARAGLDPVRRAETMSLQEFALLTDAVHGVGLP